METKRFRLGALLACGVSAPVVSTLIFLPISILDPSWPHAAIITFVFGCLIGTLGGAVPAVIFGGVSLVGLARFPDRIQRTALAHALAGLFASCVYLVTLIALSGRVRLPEFLTLPMAFREHPGVFVSILATGPVVALVYWVSGQGSSRSAVG